MLSKLLDVMLHLDNYLSIVIQQYGGWTYGLLFAIIFAETGFVMTPFLPGDSLLFAAGAFAAKGSLDIGLLFFLLAGAAILGDTVNYWMGKRIGPRVFRERSRFLNKGHLDRTRDFYAKHGAKTIILARFVPVVRTFAPFVAGVGEMSYATFLGFNVVGGLLWVAFFSLGGYFFGNIPFVQQNFSLVVLAIVAVSIVPILLDVIVHYRRRRKGRV